MNHTLDRRAFLKLVGTAGASPVALAGSLRTAAAARSRRRPNIVVVIADDQRADMMSCAGNPYITTPHFDRMAAEGLRFTNAFVNCGVCSPSRGAFLTGRHPHQVGTPTIIHMSHTFHRSHTPLPALLHEAGYTSAHFGKWHLGEGHLPKPGYDHWEGFYAVGPFFDLTMHVNGEPRHFEGFADDAIAGQAADWIRGQAGAKQPFCAWVGLKAPHLDFGYPARYNNLLEDVDIPKPPTYDEDCAAHGKAEKVANSFIRVEDFHGGLPMFDNSWDKYVKSYYRCSQTLDDSLGTIMQALDEAGAAEDTLLIYSSDQGYHLGEHGLTEKHYSYEDVMKVPMLVRYPRMIAPGQVRDELVSTMDVAATALDLAGLPVPPEMHGRSWRPLLSAGAAAPTDWRDDVMFFQEGLHLSVRTQRYKLITYPEADMESCYRLHGEGGRVTAELYDLEKDPREIHSVLNDPAYAEVLADMQRRLDRQIRETGLRPRVNETVSDPWVIGPIPPRHVEEVTRLALASPMDKGEPLNVDGATYRWHKLATDEDAGAALDTAQWIWVPGPDARDAAPTGSIGLRRVFELPGDRRLRSARIAASGDNSYTLYVNGREAGSGDNWTSTDFHDVGDLLRPGRNIVAALCRNEGTAANPAGFIAALRVEFVDGGAPMTLVTDGSWRATERFVRLWYRTDVDASGWPTAQELGPYGTSPWVAGAGAREFAAKLGGGPDDQFLVGFGIEQLLPEDPFVRVTVAPIRAYIAGWANGELLYQRGVNNAFNPFNATFNPPLKPGRNTVVLRGFLRDYPSLGVAVLTWREATQLLT